MQLIWCAFFFGLGAIIASFVGVLVARLNTGQSVVSGRSHCDACGATLSPFAMVSILSYLVSAGKAHCCRARISFLSPLTEALLGILFVLAYLLVGVSLALAFLLVVLAALLALVLYDLAHQILPPQFLIVFLVASLSYALASTADTYVLGSTLIVAGGSALFLALIHLLSGGRVMGLADAPLVFGLALLAGPLALSGFVYSFWIGGAVGIVILLGRAPGARIRVEVPFAPFLAAGFLLALFSGWNLFTLILS